VILKRDADQASLQIVDDGLGFDTQTPRSGRHIGLWSMCERVEQLGGQFEVQSAPGQGTTVTAIVPL
jgi:signal transduction histidine kinase